MASDGGTPFKDLQRWTILLVGGVSGKKVRGPGAMQAAMHANNHKRRSGTIADRGCWSRAVHRAGRGWLRLTSCG